MRSKVYLLKVSRSGLRDITEKFKKLLLRTVRRSQLSVAIFVGNEGTQIFYNGGTREEVVAVLDQASAAMKEQDRD